MPIDHLSLVQSVQLNCDISDAQYAGNYTMCIYLLKMREYFRWQNHMALTDSLDMDEVGDWVHQQEMRWEDLYEMEYQPVVMEQGSIDLYDEAQINARLRPLNLVFSSGTGRFGKPVFFLGKLIEDLQLDGVRVYIAGDELARELSAPPAMTRCGKIFIRRQSLVRMLWEMYMEWSWQKRKGPMADVVRAFDIERHPEVAILNLADAQIQVMIAHEMGEIEASELLGLDWEHQLQQVMGNHGENLMRASRDYLADCRRVLSQLVEEENTVMLDFYMASLTPLRKSLFPSLVNAYQAFRSDVSWQNLEQVVNRGHEHWLETCIRQINEDPDLMNSHPEQAVERYLC